MIPRSGNGFRKTTKPKLKAMDGLLVRARRLLVANKEVIAGDACTSRFIYSAVSVESITMIPPVRNPFTVEDISEIRMAGPWRSKSGGLLSVPFALSHAQTADFFDYDRAELRRIPRDIRGLRMFVLEDIPAAGVGGGEFHRIRVEIVFTVEGRVRWTCEDVYGNCKVFDPPRDCILRFPPFILHTMESIERDSSVIVIANTLYDADDPGTHDTYPAAEFRALQEHYQALVR
jgi:WxcM-like protein